MFKEKTFIYTLNCPETGMVRYVGKSNNPKQRLSAHLSLKKPSKKTSWILGLKNKNSLPKLEIIDEVPCCDWEFWESHYIKLFKSCGANLFNLTSGGTGCRGNDYVKNKISHGNSGKIRSIEVKERTRLLHLGRKRSLKTRIKCSRRQNGKPVYQYDKNGTLIKKWDFINIVDIGIPTQNIYACIKGNQKTAGGFIWSYSELNDVSSNLKRSGKPVVQYDLSGNFISEHESIKIASKKTKICEQNISASCKSDRRTAGGFIWKYNNNVQ